MARIQIQYVMGIRILHKIDSMQKQTEVNEDGGAEVDIIVS